MEVIQVSRLRDDLFMKKLSLPPSSLKGTTPTFQKVYSKFLILNCFFGSHKVTPHNLTMVSTYLTKQSKQQPFQSECQQFCLQRFHKVFFACRSIFSPAFISKGNWKLWRTISERARETKIHLAVLRFLLYLFWELKSINLQGTWAREVSRNPILRIRLKGWGTHPVCFLESTS